MTTATLKIFTKPDVPKQDPVYEKTIVNVEPNTIQTYTITAVRPDASMIEGCIEKYPLKEDDVFITHIPPLINAKSLVANLELQYGEAIVIFVSESSYGPLLVTAVQTGQIASDEKKKGFLMNFLLDKGTLDLVGAMLATAGSSIILRELLA